MSGLGAGQALAQVGALTININNSDFNPVVAGAPADYQVRVDNSGNFSSPATPITFTIPANTIYDGVTGFGNCTPAVADVDSPTTVPTDITCAVPAIGPGGQNAGQVHLRHMAAGTAALRATIPGGATFSRTSTVLQGADLGVTLTVPTDDVLAGDTLDFTAVVTNEGPYQSSGGTVALTLPTGLSNSFTPPPGCGIAGRTLTCALGTLPVGQSIEFDFSAQIITGNDSTIALSATVDGASPSDPDDSNDTDTKIVTVAPGTDVGLDKARAPSGDLLVGDAVTFTLTPVLAGVPPVLAEIKDEFPENYTLDPLTAVNAPPGWSCDVVEQLVTCTFDGTVAGAVFDAPITIDAIASTETDADGVTNRATISAQGENEGADGNNFANDGLARIRVPIVDLRAYKSGPPRELASDGILYPFSLRAANDGLTPTTIPFQGILRIVDHVPLGLTIVSVDAPGNWTCVPETTPSFPVVGPEDIVCTTDEYVAPNSLNIGESTDAIVMWGMSNGAAGSNQDGVIGFENTMTVEFDGYETEDGNPADNTDTTGWIGTAAPFNSADIRVEKTVVSTIPADGLYSGDAVRFRIEIINDGRGTAEDVLLTDRLNNIVHENGGAPLSVPFDTNTDDLECRVPAGSGYARDLLCDMDTLAPCDAGIDCPWVEVTVRPGSDGTYTNVANAYSFSTPDTDDSNNEDFATVEVQPRTDVTVTKMSPFEAPGSAIGVAIGQELTYVVTALVPDNGLSGADNVTIVDTLPNYVRFISLTPSSGTCLPPPPVGTVVHADDGNNTLTCNLGRIANGDQQTVTVVVVPTIDLIGEDHIINTVDVSTTTPEVNTNNNTDSVRVNLAPPSLDLVLSKVDTVDPVRIQTGTTYEVTLTNMGPSDATEVVITDILPISGLNNPVYRISDPAWQCAYENITVANPLGELVCKVDYFPAGSTVVLEVDMTAVERGRHSNTARVTSVETAGGFETITDNNEVVEDTTVRVVSDVGVTKNAFTAALPHAPISEVDLREEFAWVITVNAAAGLGLDIAEGVTLVDMLPDGMLLSREPDTDQGICTGAIDSRAVSCDLGDIAAGQTVTVTLYVRIVALGAPGQAVSNTATADTLSFDDNESNDSDTGSVMTVRAGEIAGTIWWDFDGDTVKDTHDSGVNGGVVVYLSGITQHAPIPFSAEVNLAADGTYRFENVPPGDYEVTYSVVSQPRVTTGAALPGPGTGATAVDPTHIGNIVIVQDQSSTGHDFTLVPQAIITIDKTASAPSFNQDGSYTIDYELVVTNGSREPVQAITISDELLSAAPGLFGAYTGDSIPATGTYTITEGPQIESGALTGIISGFTGQSGNTLIVSGGGLGVGQTSTITYSVRVNPEFPRVVGLSHDNTAEIVGTGEWSGQTAPDNPDMRHSKSATATPDFDAEVEIIKTGQIDRTGTIAEYHRIDYTFEIRNIGNTPLRNVTFSDPLVGLVWVDDAPIAYLAPGQFALRTAYYELTQADIDRGSVVNEASTRGEWGISGGTPQYAEDTDTETVGALSAPALSLDKTIASDTVADPTMFGDTVTYQFVVTNTGNTTLRDVVVNDPLLGTAPIPVAALLAPGEVSSPITRVYSVTQADIDRGRVPNTATASASYGPATPAATVNSAPDSESINLFQRPGVDVVKVINSASVPDVPRDGDTVSWTVTATNTGNVSLFDLVLRDPMAISITVQSGDPDGPVAPGGSVTFTVTAPLTQAHINAGEIQNQAILDFNLPYEPGDTPVAGTPKPSGNTPGGPEEPTVTPLNQVPEIGLIKAMITPLDSLPDPITANSVLEYQFTIRNLGNLPLHRLTLNEDLAPFAMDPNSQALLDNAVLQAQNAGGTLTGHEIVLTGSYTLTQDDVDAGHVTNQALVTGYPTDGPTGTLVDDTSGTAIDNDLPTITSFTRAPQISLVKSIESMSWGTNLPQVGDTITYGFAITNVGNVTLDTIAIEELLIGSTILNPSNWSGPLAPTQTESAAITATYVLQQADIDRGEIENSAEVSGFGMGPNGLQEVTDLSGSAVTNDDPTVQNLPIRAEVTIVKSETAALSSPPTPGDVISYSFLVTNTGNVTLTNVVVDDPLVGLDMPVTTIPTLLPGANEAVTLDATYIVQQRDIEFGRVDNQASVTGSYFDPATQQPAPTGAQSNPITVPLAQVPSIALIKTASAALNDPTAVGETIEYNFIVRNTGNLELTNVVINDPLPGVTPSQFVIGTLAPGAQETAGPAIYQIVQADIDRGEVENQARVSGIAGVNGPNPTPVEDLSGPTFEEDAPVIVPVFQPRPSLAIEKTSEFLGGASYALVDDLLRFTFSIENTGNVTITGVAPEELDFTFGGTDATGTLGAFVPANADIAPGQVVVFTADYALTQDDLNAGAGVTDGVNNTARASGLYAGAPVVSDPDTATLTLLPQPPSDVTITKTTTRPSIRRGETVPFTIVVENHSLADAGEITITDRMPAGFMFVEGSAQVDGVAVTPVVNGRDVVFERLRLVPEGRIEITLTLRALPATPPGRYTNIALGADAIGTPLADEGRAQVEIIAEAVFDCSDVIGTVFNDRNGNGYQDEGEPGIGGVRLATARGLLVTTDAFGRFSIPCAALPDQQIGSNFVLKIDERTLPTGFVLTTDNPAMARLTAGRVVEVNFGVGLGREIGLTLGDGAFMAGSTQMTADLAAGIDQLVGMLADEPARLVLTFETGDGALAAERLAGVVALIEQRWRDAGAPYDLATQTTIVER